MLHELDTINYILTLENDGGQHTSLFARLTTLVAVRKQRVVSRVH